MSHTYKHHLSALTGLFLGLLLIPSRSAVQPRPVATNQPQVVASTAEADPLASAYEFLCSMMDRYHTQFDIYSDKDAGGNHFVPDGWMGDLGDLKFDAGCKTRPQSNPTCIRITYTPRGSHRADWAGIYWLTHERNWGDTLGLPLYGATTLKFSAAGENGGERMEFKVGGVNRPPHHNPSKRYQDSFEAVSTDVVELTQEWREYSLDLPGEKFSGRLLGGFCIATNVHQNPRGCTVYLDDIYFDLPRLDEPRFLTSFVATKADGDEYMANVAFVYDNALALLAFLSVGGDSAVHRAELIGDAMVYAQNHDRYFQDGRLRNAYRSGRIADHLTGDALLPGWWDRDSAKWFEDSFQVGTHVGNAAWAIIALTQLHRQVGDPKYLNAAIKLGQWITDSCRSEVDFGGFTGGFEKWEPDPEHGSTGQVKVTWKSTEHNLDVWAAFMAIYELSLDEIWKTRALHAKRFVEAMWDEAGGHFWTGTSIREPDSVIEINKAKWPLDVNPWTIMSLGNAEKYGGSLGTATDSCYVELCPSGCGVSGYDFDSDKDGVWYEGTAQMAVAYQILGEWEEAEELLEGLRKVQRDAKNADGRGLVAACHDSVSTNFGWFYKARLHVGATAWMMFAETKINPYWGLRTDEEIPFQDVR